MKTIILDLYHFVFLILLISSTAWVWIRSLNICPKTYSDEYVMLNHKYNKLLKEKKKIEATLQYIENTLNTNY